MISLDRKTDASSYFGMPVFADKKLFFKEASANGKEKQEIALLIAKQLIEFVRAYYVFSMFTFDKICQKFIFTCILICKNKLRLKCILALHAENRF